MSQRAKNCIKLITKRTINNRVCNVAKRNSSFLVMFGWGILLYQWFVVVEYYKKYTSYIVKNKKKYEKIAFLTWEIEQIISFQE